MTVKSSYQLFIWNFLFLFSLFFFAIYMQILRTSSFGSNNIWCPFFLVINPSSEMTGFVNNFGWVEQHILIASSASAEFFSLPGTTNSLQNHTNSADPLPEIISTSEPLNHNSAVTFKDGILVFTE